MWAGTVVAAIALAAAAFMLRFLIGLLRESAPSVCYWVGPVRQEFGKKVHLKVLGGTYVDDDRCATECSRGDYNLESLELKGHAEEECSSDPTALDVRPASAHSVWRSIHPSRGGVFRGQRL